MSQLKDEVRLQYEKMHQILDEDLRKTMEILDKAQAKFCNENAAQVLHLNERMQEAKKLLSSVQVMFDKTEDINFMKVRQAAHARVGRGLWRGLVVWEGLGRCGLESRMGTLAGLSDASRVLSSGRSQGEVGQAQCWPQMRRCHNWRWGWSSPCRGRGAQCPWSDCPGGPWKLTLKGGMAAMAGIGLTDQSFSFHF